MTGGILVVDDSEGERTLLANLLGRSGYRVTTAPGNARVEALAAVLSVL